MLKWSWSCYTQSSIVATLDTSQHNITLWSKADTQGMKESALKSLQYIFRKLLYIHKCWEQFKAMCPECLNSIQTAINSHGYLNTSITYHKRNNVCTISKTITISKSLASLLQMSHCLSCHTVYHVTLSIMSHCLSCHTAYHVTLSIMSHCLYHVTLPIMSHCLSWTTIVVQRKLWGETTK